jgi:PleD family two-component response regulator
VRYARHEFLVVAPGLDAKGANDRVAALRDRLEGARDGDETIRFSAGIAELRPGGDPDQALRDADEAMYEAKAWSAGRGSQRA